MTTPSTHTNYLDGLVLPTPDGGQVRTRLDEHQVSADESAPALFPDVAGGSRAAPLAFDWLSAPNYAEDLASRGAPQSEMAASPVAAITTAVVLGRARNRTEWVSLFFPGTLPLSSNGGLATSENFLYQVWGTSHLGNFDTRLPERAPFSMSGLDSIWVEETIEAHGWATSISDTERARALRQTGWLMLKAELPMLICNRRLEFIAAEKLTDTTAESTFATGHITQLAPGAEWDQAGSDLRGDVMGGASLVARKCGAGLEDVTWVLSQSAYEAALRNDGYRQFHNGVALVDAANAAINATRLAQYVGVGQVRVINPTGPDGLPMFGDVAWLVCQGPNTQEWDDSYGTQRFGARFAPNDGLILEPWAERMIRVTVYAALKEYRLTVLNPEAGYLFTNCSSEL